MTSCSFACLLLLPFGVNEPQVGLDLTVYLEEHELPQIACLYLLSVYIQPDFVRLGIVWD